MTNRPDRSTIRRVADRARAQLQQGLERPPVVDVRRRVAARLRDLSHRVEGLAYRVAERHPDPDVDDAVLTQRIRSQLGPLERRLDVPRVNVTVQAHIAELRGAVGNPEQAEALVEAVRDVSGVHGVLSFLHLGYGPGDTTPSAGRARPAPSEAWRELVGSVREFGEDDRTAVAAATAVIVTLLDVLPEGERDHLRSHLPADVRGHVDAVVRVGQPPRPRTADEFIAAVADTAAAPHDTAELATRHVFATLQQLVPEETADITAVLPGRLKDLWRAPLQPTSGVIDVR